LQTRSWDKDGQKQYRTEIVAETVQFGPRSSGGGNGGSSQADYSGVSDAEAPQKAPKDDAIDYPAEDINPDDIPFQLARRNISRSLRKQKIKILWQKNSYPDSYSSSTTKTPRHSRSFSTRTVR